MLFKNFRLTISIGIGQPKLFSILLIVLMPAMLAPLSSITIFLGEASVNGQKLATNPLAAAKSNFEPTLTDAASCVKGRSLRI